MGLALDGKPLAIDSDDDSRDGRVGSDRRIWVVAAEALGQDGRYHRRDSCLAQDSVWNSARHLYAMGFGAFDLRDGVRRDRGSDLGLNGLGKLKE